MTERDVADIERRLDAGEWLLPGEVGALFGKNRYAADNWINQAKIRIRRTPGNYRECHPADVRKMLDAWRQQYRGGKPVSE